MSDHICNPSDPHDDTGLNALANELVEADFSTVSRIRDPLRTQLLEQLLAEAAQPAPVPQIETESNPEEITMLLFRKRTRRLQNIAAAVAAFIILVVTVPPLRSLAQEIIVRIGGMIITDAPTPNELPPDAVEPIQIMTPLNEIVPVYNPYISATQIEAETGMVLYAPLAHPVNFQMTSRSLSESAGVIIISTTYYRRFPVVNLGRAEEVSMIQITQQRFTENIEHEFPIGDANVRPVIVRGLPAAWVEGAAYQTPNILFWQEDGYVFQLSSNGMTLEQTLQFAESLVEVDTASEVGKTIMQNIFQIVERTDRPIYLPWKGGITSYYPSFIPEGYSPEFEAAVDAIEVMNVITAYPGYADPSGEGNGSLFLYQSFDPEAFNALMDGLNGEAISVRGSAGVWLEDAPLRLEYPPHMPWLDDERFAAPASGWRLLAWQQDSITFAVQANLLSQAQLLEFAEGLQPLERIDLRAVGSQTPAGNVRFDEKATVETLAGFAIYSWVPEPGVIRRFGYALASENSTTTVTYYEQFYADLGERLLYQSVAPLPVESAPRFTLPEAKNVSISHADDTITATWYNDVVISTPRPNSVNNLLERWDVLVWEMDGYYFRLQTNAIPRDEVLALVESLTAIQ